MLSAPVVVGEVFITPEQFKTIVRANDQNDRNCAKCENNLSGRFSLGGRCCCLRGGRSCAKLAAGILGRSPAACVLLLH
jgi:hypothetical protein